MYQRSRQIGISECDLIIFFLISNSKCHKKNIAMMNFGLVCVERGGKMEDQCMEQEKFGRS